MAETRLFLLGPPRFEREGAALELTTAKGAALLGYLAATRGAQARERVAALLWPDSHADAARKNLRNTLWAIRKALGDAVLDADSDWLALGEAWVDLWAWERLSTADTLAEQSQAIACYGGPLLDGLVVTDAPDFELWLTTERERLEQAHLRLLDRLVAAQRQAGQWREVLAVARQAVRLDPLQEPMHRALMEAHARLGQRAEALRQYDALREVLARELGVEPLADSEALREAILAGIVSPYAVTRPAPPASSPPPAPVPAAPVAEVLPFVGREAERAALQAAYAQAAGSHAQVVALVGEMGIGKSRLWQAWSATLPAHQPVLATRCLDTTRALPLAPLAELFRGEACERQLFGPEPSVAPIWLAALARLLPDLRAAHPSLPPLPDLPPDEERYRLFDAFIQVLRTLAGRPLVLFVDDLHWADRATLDWLRYLVHRLRDEPLLLVVAYRATDAPPSVSQAVAEWGREGRLRRMALAPLSEQEARALVTAMGGDEGLARRAHQRSGGNPYFLTELVRAAPDATPPGLTDLVRARLDRLPDAARQVLQAAAVLAPDFGFASLRRTAGRGEEETLDALDALLAAGILVEEAGRYQFAQPFVGAVVREGLSGARRAFLHRRAARAREVESELPAQAGLLATHWAEANDPARAARYAEMAAEHALSLAAPAEAVEWYGKALSWEATPTRQMGLGRAQLWQGEIAAAQAAFERAREMYEARGDELGAARASLTRAETFLALGRPDETLRAAEQGMGYLAHEELDAATHAHAHFLLGAGHLSAGEGFDEASRHLREAADLAQKGDLPAMAARAFLELGNLRAERGELRAARAVYADSLAAATRAGDPLQMVLAHNNAAYHALLDGDLPAAHDHVEQGLALTEAHALRMPLQYLLSTRGEIALAEADWDAAAGWLARARQEAEARHNRKQAANVRATLALVARGRGALDEALAGLEAARAEAAGLVAPHLQAQIDLWLADLHLARDDHAAARAALDRAATHLAGGARRRLQAQADALRARLAHLTT